MDSEEPVRERVGLFSACAGEQQPAVAAAAEAAATAAEEAAGGVRQPGRVRSGEKQEQEDREQEQRELAQQQQSQEPAESAQQQSQAREQRQLCNQQQQESSSSSLPWPPHLWGWEESAAVSRLRFEAEAEFVQALGNPRYLQYLYQQRYFDDERFIAYLQYLNYWREPAYAQHLLFPVGLAVLDLLQQQQLVDALGSEEAVSLLERTLRLHWLYFQCDKNK